MDYRELENTKLETRAFPEVAHGFRVLIAEEAFDRACDGVDTTREVGGILVGEVLRDAAGPYVYVDAVIEALHAVEKGTELTITHDTWSHISEQMDTVHTGKRIVGWYHTHPDFGIFLSERDRFIQQSFFDSPYQIAFVYDPCRREHGVFAWRDNKPWRMRRYWIGEREYTWDGPREGREAATAMRAAAEPGKSDAPQTAAPPPAQASDLMASLWLIGVAVAALMLGFAAGSRWGGGGRFFWNGTAAEPDLTARQAVASINTDLLAVIRETVRESTLDMTFEQGIGHLDRALEALRPLASDPSATAARQSVEEAKQLLGAARQDRAAAREMLRSIEEVTRQERTPEFLKRDLSEQRDALGEVYAEMARDAERNKDGERVAKLLDAAAKVNPTRRAQYEAQLKKFKEGQTQGQGQGVGSASPSGGGTPPAKPSPPAQQD